MCQLSIIDFLNISLFLLSLHIICVLLFKLQAIDTFISFFNHSKVNIYDYNSI